MARHDEASAIIRGQIQVHEHQIEVCMHEKEKHTKAIEQLDYQIGQFNKRIGNLRDTLDALDIVIHPFMPTLRSVS